MSWVVAYLESVHSRRELKSGPFLGVSKHETQRKNLKLKKKREREGRLNKIEGYSKIHKGGIKPQVKYKDWEKLVRVSKQIWKSR